MHDVLIVLGYSIDSSDPVFQARVNKAVELYHAGAAPQVIMSGCCSDKLDIKPRTTEAAAMRDFAIEQGLPASVVMLEEQSVDTLGNFYFSKINILESCSWYNIGFVSTPWHTYRSEWLAAQILGPDYDITGYASDEPAGWTETEKTTSQHYNERLLHETKALLSHIEPGDHQAIHEFLGTTPRR
jgi:uncharacterized SAM-binding protein YcdF (DUF218 family)